MSKDTVSTKARDSYHCRSCSLCGGSIDGGCHHEDSASAGLSCGPGLRQCDRSPE